jgi:hypothetical protein
MRTFMLLSALVSFLFAQNDPCNDIQYLSLKQISLDSMSQRQFEYFMLKEKQCGDIRGVTIMQADSATINVAILNLNKYKIEFSTDWTRKVRDVRIFVDNIPIGKPPTAVCRVCPGQHTVSLFSKGEIEIDGPRDRARMNTGVITIEVASGSTTYVDFDFVCAIGGNLECDGNEWHFESMVSPK